MSKSAKITWGRPLAFIREQKFPDLKDLTGVYAIYSKNALKRYSGGASKIVYFGSGNIGERLEAHASGSGDRMISQLLIAHEKSNWSMEVVTAEAESGEVAQCVEDRLLELFEKKYESLPVGNQQRPKCRVEEPLEIEFETDIIEEHDCP